MSICIANYVNLFNNSLIENFMPVIEENPVPFDFFLLALN